MTAFRIPTHRDAVAPTESEPIVISVDDTSVQGVSGQTIAGVLLASDRLSWRATSARGAKRGLFCGIGVCFDCIAEVNGERDVRLCQRRATDGDSVRTQHDAMPVPVPEEGIE